MSLFNAARGEVLAVLDGAEVRLCVTLRALAQLESHFAVAGFEALAERLKSLNAGDLGVVLKVLSLDDISTLDITAAEAIRAVIAAFEAMNND